MENFGQDPFEEIKKQRENRKRSEKNGVERARLKRMQLALREEKKQLQNSVPEAGELELRMCAEIDSMARKYEGAIRERGERVSGLHLSEPGALHFYFGDLLRAGVKRLFAGHRGGISDQHRQSQINSLNNQIMTLQREIDSLGG